jgi:hypothetical protein
MADWEDAPVKSKPSSGGWEDAPALKAKAEPFTAEKIIPEAISNLESLARGGVAGTVASIPAVAGVPGSIEELGRAGLRKMGAKVSAEPSLPTMGQIYEPVAKKVKGAIPRITTPTTEAGGFETVGEVIGVPVTPKTAPLAALKTKTGKEALEQGLRTKMGNVADIIRTPKPIAEKSGFVSLGEKLEEKVKGAAGAKYEQRSKQAETLYDNALETARKIQAEKGSFANSGPGQQLLNDLEASKKVIAGGREYVVGEDKVKAIDRLITAIKATRTGGEVVPVGKGKVSARMETRRPAKVTEKDVDAIVEELRFLREVNKPGTEYTGYGALDANTRRDLINKLQNSLYTWSPEYRVADETYKKSSEALRPFQTKLMDKLLKREKYDRSELATDTEKFADEFFNSRDSVRNLKVAINDDKFVQDLGKDYAATVMSNKSPTEIKNFAFDPKNEGWLTEAGIKDVVQDYAKKATTAEDRQKILKSFAIWSAAGAAGAGTYGALRSVFGY